VVTSAAVCAAAPDVNDRQHQRGAQATAPVLRHPPLLTIEVGGQPSPCERNFCSTTDVGFGPDGRIFIADGYANGRVLEYTADGRKVREWGNVGSGPGQMRVVHSLVVGLEGVVYVADRIDLRNHRSRGLDCSHVGLPAQ
jgi:hypothetical protein